MNLPSGILLQGGKYRIVRFIGSGGFGCTYEAEHVMLEKRVAIKEFFVKDFCNRDETTSNISVAAQSKKALVEKLRSKFMDEAKSLFRLKHPGIVHVSDVFEENGTVYYVMDYIDGRSLQDIVASEGFLPESRAVKYIRQVADALGYVHSNNRLHLDIKPGNIMVDSSDNAILIDFGASKQYDEDSGENHSTMRGMTRGYAPPEQMSSSLIKFYPATDIYSLGATFYKILSGETPLDTSERISGEELRPLPSGISRPVCQAIKFALELNKTKRPQSIAEFLSILAPSASDNREVGSEETILSDTVFRRDKPDDGGHASVDLGLSVKWAACNIGASRPSDIGDYYAWGELTPKADYVREDCNTNILRLTDISGNPKYDAARANWGGSWRMPTEEEIHELIHKCKWIWTIQGGRTGFKVIGRNGNFIFLPAGGCMDGTKLSRIGYYGFYWSSSVPLKTLYVGHTLFFSNSESSLDWFYRYQGQTIRPVRDK